MEDKDLLLFDLSLPSFSLPLLLSNLLEFEPNIELSLPISHPKSRLNDSAIVKKLLLIMGDF